MEFEENPRRCYLCGRAFMETIKPIPIIAGTCAPGYVCPNCHSKLLSWVEEARKRQEVPHA